MKKEVNYSMEIYFPNGEAKKLGSNQILMNLRLGDKFIYESNRYIVHDREVEYNNGEVKEVIILK